MSYLKDEEAKKIGIGKSLELLEKVKWQEVENVVFGGLDGIVLRREQCLIYTLSYNGPMDRIYCSPSTNSQLCAIMQRSGELLSLHVHWF